MRFFGDNASWNRPVTDFGEAPGMGDYPRRLTAAGKLTPAFSAYSVPILDRAQATTTAKVFQPSWAAAQLTSALPAGGTIPWHPAWANSVPPGNDRTLIIVDRTTGEVWELWIVGTPGLDCLTWANVFGGLYVPGGYKLSVAAVSYWRDCRTAVDDGRVWLRGCGLHKLAMIVRAQEVLDGAIRHALPLTVPNPMFGPMANPPIGGAGAGAGTTRGFYMRPATRLEHADPATLGLGGVTTTATDAQRARSVPSGMRFAIRATDADISAWLDSRGYTGALRQTARIFAVALRDYGAIVAETGGMSSGIHGIETDGLADPATRYLWAQAGITGDGTDYPLRDLLAGLVSADRLFVVAQP